MKKKVTVKIPKAFIFIVAFLFVAIIIKLSYVSMSSSIDGINLHEFANNRNTKTETIYAKRGNIFDKDGNTLAQNVNSYTLIAYLEEKRTTDPSNPMHVVDKEKTAKMLHDELGLDYDKALKTLNQEGKYQVEFAGAKDISETQKNKIESLDMPGIDFIPGQKRNYNMGAFASYIVGYAKMNDGNIKGELGIESYFDEELSGIDGSTTYQTDAYGYTLPSAEVITTKAIDGDDIYLTIDQNIQMFAETLTHDLDSDYDMEWMIFTVMDAKTGAIVASSTVPNFDPNKLDITSYMNPLVSYEYEPGSTMKIFSFASSIEEGIYNGNETYESGKKKIGKDTVSDWNKNGWGNITFDKGFVYSSNVAASILGERLQKDKLTDYYKKLGFSKKTGIELANEVSGKVNIRYDIELANAAFGQGITVTPIQMMQALSALTNDGVILKPYIVDKIIDCDGNTVYEGKREEIAKVYSKETMDYIKNLMYRVVYDNDSIATSFRPSKTKMIGKTGTAQIASPTGGYLTGDTNYIRSFAGIFPDDEPRYIVYIAAQQMNTSSSKPLGDALTKAVDDIVAYLGIENKTDKMQEKIVELNNYMSSEVIKVVDELKKKQLKVYTLGTGKYVINQYPLKGSKVVLGSKVFIVSNKNDFVMEDMTGWSLNEAMTYANLLKIKLDVKGYGYVKKQSIAPKTKITNDMTLTIELEYN